MVEKSPTKCSLQTRGVHSRKEKGGRERRELVSKIDMNKRAPYPSLYRPRRGATSPNFPCGTIPKGGGAPIRGVGPFLAPWPMGEDSLSP